MHQIGQNTDPKLIIFSHLERYCMYFLKNQYCAVRIEVAPEIFDIQMSVVKTLSFCFFPYNSKNIPSTLERFGQLTHNVEN